jgi:hypothetical protein
MRTMKPAQPNSSFFGEKELQLLHRRGLRLDQRLGAG